MSLVLRSQLDEVVARLSTPGEYGLDTETTGLMEKDRLFSLILHDGRQGWYFNTTPYPDVDPEGVLSREDLRRLQPIFSQAGSTFYISNALFDMGMLRKEGLVIRGKVFCTQSLGRVLKNNFPVSKFYSLGPQAKMYLGMEKDESVEKYISKNKLWEWKSIPGKQKRVKDKFFYKVPYSVVAPYGEHDALLHIRLGKFIQEKLARWDRDLPARPIGPLVKNEMRLLKTLHRMQRAGVKIDRTYTEKALFHEQGIIAAGKAEFKKISGRDFLASNKLLAEVFKAQGVESPKRTKTGAFSWDDDALDRIEHPLARCIQRIRHHEKRAGSYYSSFLYYADSRDVVRASPWPGGAETGRFSYSDPSMQNIPKEDDEEDTKKPYIVRGCFVPRPGFCFFDPDYQQQEFRLMLDYAGEMKLIRMINEGADVHQATADLCGITRKQAKTINFGLLYGMGTEKLAKALGLTIQDAMNLKQLYFARLPRVKMFIREVIARGEQRGFVFNWFGRRCHISDPEFAYILPNHIIQGGGADVLKIAMNRIDAYLLQRKARSRMLLQVHDQLLLEMHKDELDLAPEIVGIMESVYRPKNKMKLTCSASHSWERWGKKFEKAGYPS